MKLPRGNAFKNVLSFRRPALVNVSTSRVLQYGIEISCGNTSFQDCHFCGCSKETAEHVCALR
jgi:hypothetical protein